MLKARNLPILMYHHVSRCPGLVTLTPETFREQMGWLAKRGWKTLTSSEIETFYHSGIFPRKSVVLTFDDGYLDNWLNAYPILKEFNLNAHIFLITGLIGSGPVRRKSCREYAHWECQQLIQKGRSDDVMLRWSEVHEMLRDRLVEFHVHTHSHQRWDRLLVTQKEQCEHLYKDILLSKKSMIEHTGICSQHLCWPEGYYNQDYIKVAKELGFSYLYTTERRMNNTDKGTLQLGRISTKERESSMWLKRRLFYYTTPFFSSLLAYHKGPRICEEIK